MAKFVVNCCNSLWCTLACIRLFKMVVSNRLKMRLNKYVIVDKCYHNRQSWLTAWMTGAILSLAIRRKPTSIFCWTLKWLLISKLGCDDRRQKMCRFLHFFKTTAATLLSKTWAIRQQWTNKLPANAPLMAQIGASKRRHKRCGSSSTHVEAGNSDYPNPHTRYGSFTPYHMFEFATGDVSRNVSVLISLSTVEWFHHVLRVETYS